MTIVETLFIDMSTGKAIGQAKMPLEKLPQSFAHETTMHIGDEDWKVINAEPVTAEGIHPDRQISSNAPESC